jgi:ABC-type dipeptide/oligopeptide/nickel transport system permease subunit
MTEQTAIVQLFVPVIALAHFVAGFWLLNTWLLSHLKPKVLIAGECECRLGSLS